ncbi:hypothetical protein FWH58_01590, partial [Candidatus Saccharibacteria bacterium]|nr:hypothetical protein [Candidatus Saccharibacteria bacterium]
RLFENGKKVAPVVGFARASDGGGVDNVYRKDREKKRDYVFVTHAAGLRLNDLYGYSKPVDKVRERLQGPEAYYNDVVDTFLSILMDSCIRPDISAPNTIYQLVSGFNFVDFNHNNLNTKVNIGQYYKHHVADFLKAFVFSEGNKDSRENKGGRRRRFFPDEQDRQEYRAVAAQELGLLVGKLYKNGISEEHIDYGLKLTGFYDIAKSALQLMC